MGTDTDQYVNEAKDYIREVAKIPISEFEQQFREWMERDEVARHLQTKMRTELIHHFQRTALGKQINSQSSLLQHESRLILSPMILAVNTMVAEFLYAVNCHFSLSVFSTEVPFRNFPNFGESAHFRFSETEIINIVEAIYGRNGCDMKYKYQIVRDYVENEGTSLLISVFKHLTERDYKTGPIRLARKLIPTKKAADDQRVRERMDSINEMEHQIYTKNFRYLNKYLMVLSRKFCEMTQKLDHFQKSVSHFVRVSPRVKKPTAITRKIDRLNHTIANINTVLKNSTYNKSHTKEISTIVNAIMHLGEEFSKCANRFDEVGNVVPLRKKKTNQIEMTNKSMETDPIPVVEKSYPEWIREMRTTKNGEIFLNKVDSALRKALHKQKKQLQKQNEEKLKRQKIYFKHKLIAVLSNHISSHTVAINTKLKDIEESKLQDLSEKVNHIEHIVEDVQQKLPTEGLDLRYKQPIIKEERKDIGVQSNINTKVATTESQILRNIINEVTNTDRDVDDFLITTKTQMVELEKAAIDLDKSFTDYLQSNKLKPGSPNAEMAHKFFQNRERMMLKIQQCNLIAQLNTNDGDVDEDVLSRTSMPTAPVLSCFNSNINSININESEQHSANPILEVKEQFFKQNFNKNYSAQPSYIWTNKPSRIGGGCTASTAIHSDGQRTNVDNTSDVIHSCYHNDQFGNQPSTHQFKSIKRTSTSPSDTKLQQKLVDLSRSIAKHYNSDRVQQYKQYHFATSADTKDMLEEMPCVSKDRSGSQGNIKILEKTIVPGVVYYKHVTDENTQEIGQQQQQQQQQQQHDQQEECEKIKIKSKKSPQSKKLLQKSMAKMNKLFSNTPNTSDGTDVKIKRIICNQSVVCAPRDNEMMYLDEDDSIDESSPPEENTLKDVENNEMIYTYDMNVIETNKQKYNDGDNVNNELEDFENDDFDDVIVELQKSLPQIRDAVPKENIEDELWQSFDRNYLQTKSDLSEDEGLMNSREASESSSSLSSATSQISSIHLSPTTCTMRKTDSDAKYTQ